MNGVFYGKPTVIACPGLKAPPKLSGHRVVCTDTCLYSFGGYSPSETNKLVTELWQFHLYRKEWTKIPLKGNVPQEVASSAAVLLNERTLILIGGTGLPFGQRRNADVFVCNLQRTDEEGAVTWQRLPVHGDIPLARYGQAIAVHNRYLYSVGGTDGHIYSIEVHRLDLKTLQWELVCAETQDGVVGFGEPEKRYRHEIVIFNDELFVFGGGTPFSVFGFQTMPVFNLTTRKWTFRQTEAWQCPSGALRYPSGRRCHSVVLCGDWAVLAGGVGDQDSMYDDLWKLHLPTMRWVKISCSLPQGIYFHSATVSPAGRMYLFGGVIDLQNEQRTNDLCALDLCVPPLQEMCLGTVTAEPRFRLTELDSCGLTKIGIPYMFHNKIIG